MQSATGMSDFAKTLKCTCTNITNCLCAVYKFMLDVTVSACVVRNLLNDDDSVALQAGACYWNPTKI